MAPEGRHPGTHIAAPAWCLACPRHTAAAGMCGQPCSVTQAGARHPGPTCMSLGPAVPRLPSGRGERLSVAWKPFTFLRRGPARPHLSPVPSPFFLLPATCPAPWPTRCASAARRASPPPSASSTATESCTTSTASCVPSASGRSLRGSSTR